VEDCLRGVHSSCFTYGHTGSGKTYTLFGAPHTASQTAAAGSVDSYFNPAQILAENGPGLAPRICYELVNRLEELRGGAQEVSLGLGVTFIEIYNDKIRDLLNTGADSSKFKVREHPEMGPYVVNLAAVQVQVSASNGFPTVGVMTISSSVCSCSCV
jgi:Kinesin motor domain